jgi:3-oxoadipate CoA-transferase beta subunit
MAQRLSSDISDGWFVNLGIGMPTMLADVTESHREIVFHSENGIVGMGPYAGVDSKDDDLINADKEYVTVVTGAAYMSHCDSFGLIRGGHLDLAVMGAFQAAVNGDFANWKVPGSKIDAVGGAMDLAAGAARVWIMMDLFDRAGESKLREHCTYPLTGCGVVERVYTDLAVFEITGEGILVVEITSGWSFNELQNLVPVPLRMA